MSGMKNFKKNHLVQHKRPDLVVHAGHKKENHSALASIEEQYGRRSEVLTGCLSKISLPLKKDGDYYSAVKRYAEMFSFESKCVPLNAADAPVRKDFAAMTTGKSLWMDTLEKKRVRKTSVSEDDVELHGYLGWLRS